MMKHSFLSSLSVEKLNRILRTMIYVVAGLVVICLISLLFLLARSCGASPSGHDTADSTTPASTVADPAGVILPATDDAGMEYQNSLIFVGDSLTAHLVSRGVLTGGKNTTQVWRTQSNMLNLNSEITSAKIILPGTGESMTIPEAAERVKPKILIITLGTDWGVSYLNETDFKTCYTKLITAVKEASPSTTVVLQSIFPVADSCKTLSNQKIDTANTWVKAIAADTGCRYLDTQSVLKDDSNCLKASYCISADGIHLTADAYRVVLTYIRTHAVK